MIGIIGAMDEEVAILKEKLTEVQVETKAAMDLSLIHILKRYLNRYRIKLPPKSSEKPLNTSVGFVFCPSSHCCKTVSYTHLAFTLSFTLSM